MSSSSVECLKITAKTRHQLQTDALAKSCYWSAAFTLMCYALGMVYTATAISLHEHSQFLMNSLSPTIWEAFWAFDLCFYFGGILATISMTYGVARLRPLFMVSWIVHSCVVCAKHMTHLIAVLAYARQPIPIWISGAQLAASLLLVHNRLLLKANEKCQRHKIPICLSSYPKVVCVFLVITKYDQLNKIQKLNTRKSQTSTVPFRSNRAGGLGLPPPVPPHRHPSKSTTSTLTMSSVSRTSDRTYEQPHSLPKPRSLPKEPHIFNPMPYQMFNPNPMPMSAGPMIMRNAAPCMFLPQTVPVLFPWDAPVTYNLAPASMCPYPAIEHKAYSSHSQLLPRSRQSLALPAIEHTQTSRRSVAFY